MSFTYVLSTNVGKVRLLINDTTSATAQLTDEEITTILGLNDSDIFLSAAVALKTIAASKSLLSKRVKAGNYEEDPKDVVASLLKVATNYEERSRLTPADANAEIFYTNFNYNAILNQKALRGENE